MKRFACAVAAAALLAAMAGCSSSGGSSQPPAHIAAHAGNFATLAPACSLVSAPTLKALGMPAAVGHATSAQRGNVREKTCAWGSTTKSLQVIADLFTKTTGESAAAAAKDQFQENTSEQAQADGSRGHAVSGLANEAFTVKVTRSGESDSQVIVRDQNVLVNVNYGVATAPGQPSAASAASQGALTAARAVLSALSSS